MNTTPFPPPVALIPIDADEIGLELEELDPIDISLVSDESAPITTEAAALDMPTMQDVPPAQNTIVGDATQLVAPAGDDGDDAQVVEARAVSRNMDRELDAAEARARLLGGLRIDATTPAATAANVVVQYQAAQTAPLVVPSVQRPPWAAFVDLENTSPKL